VRRRYEDDIARAWGAGGDGDANDDTNGDGEAKDTTNDTTNDEVVVGLSVRSLLDAYLTGRNFPSGSEIILAPCITIPGMVQVLQHHGIRVVPVDILPPPFPCGSGSSGSGSDDNAEDDANDGSGEMGRIGVDVDAVERAITPRTVAILVTHPFGLVCTTDEDMTAIRSLANRHDLDVIEDRAECYTGRRSGSDSRRRQDTLAHSGRSGVADICFYSFGTIKTATALGGGIAIVRRDKEGLADQMRRAQLFSGQQTNAQYLAKLIKCLVLQFVSFYPSLCGIVAFVMRTFGLDYDRTVTSMLRGFQQRDLIGQIRKRPCTALLSLLHRRLSYSSASTTASVVSARVRRCQSLSQQLVKSCSHSVRVPRGVEGSRHCYWLFPVHVGDPNRMSKLLEREGFDAPSGASQLTSATMLDGVHGDCPMAELLMKGIIYLPAPSYPLSKSLVHRIVRVLRCDNEAREGTSNARAQMMKENRLHFATRNAFLLLGIGSVAALWIWPFNSIRGALEAVLWGAFGCGMIVLVLRYFISQDYMQLSTAMSKHSVDDIGSCEGPGCSAQNGCALDAAALKVPSVETTDPDDLVLLTGATGFIGSLLLRELLLHREKLGVAGVVVLCRSKGSRSPQDRMAEVLSEDMFSFLSDKEKDDLVLVIEGDVTQPDVGMSRQDLLRVKNELGISRVFHCAASVSFTQSLEDAAASNITSSLPLQQLTKQLKRKDAKFVYISTAFVHGGSTGTGDSPLPEQVHRMHPYDPQALYRSMLETQSYASAAMHDLGFPNTYTFSKCICEHLLLRDANSDTIIIRPSIVGPAVQEPREGWAGSKPSTLVAAACLYLKFPYNLWSFGKTSVPFVPVDVVCRFVLSKAFESLEKEEDERSSHHLARSDSVAGSRSISSASTEDGSYQKVNLPTCDDILSTSSPSSSDASISSSASRNSRTTKRIFTACWDSKSQASASFL
jgi:dTDP-4-amino-4,6-dideoxygalactose transaminase